MSAPGRHRMVAAEGQDPLRSSKMDADLLASDNLCESTSHKTLLLAQSQGKGKGSTMKTQLMKIFSNRYITMISFLVAITLFLLDSYSITSPVAIETHSSNNVNGESKLMPRVQYSDIIMREDFWLQPIVVEEYKLIFFPVPKVGCTEWKMLFRRMMGYDEDMNINDIHDYSKKNGLRYLRSYPISKVQEIMTSSKWTRAIFVREPKERALSAFLNKFVDPIDGEHFRKYCCGNLFTSGYFKYKECRRKQEEADFTYFLKRTLDCVDAHWTPQSDRVDEKFWPFINFIGYMHTVGNDSKTLLESITSTLDGKTAWETHAKTGWGDDGKQGFMQRPSTYHPTNAKEKMKKYYDPCSEMFVEQQLARDWENEYFNFDEINLYDDNEKDHHGRCHC